MEIFDKILWKDYRYKDCGLRGTFTQEEIEKAEDLRELLYKDEKIKNIEHTYCRFIPMKRDQEGEDGCQYPGYYLPDFKKGKGAFPCTIIHFKEVEE